MDPGVETLLAEADRMALRSISQRARCTVLILRSLRPAPRPLGVESLEAMMEGLGYRCPVARLAATLERLGLLECGTGGGCRLTGAGRYLADAVNDVVEEMRRFAYRVVRGEYTEAEAVAELLTPSASVEGVVEAYLEDSGMLPLYLAVHAYISSLTAALLALLSRFDARLSLVLREALG